MPDLLHSLQRKLSDTERERFDMGDESDRDSRLVIRDNGSPIELGVLDALLNDANERRTRGEWPDRAVSDRWLAPRVHYALRLHRSDAGDRGVWQWLALRYRWYVEWRWQDKDGAVAENRWWGEVHKQSFARLWWGAELFRDGPDYRPVERAFVFQDLPNSYLHRPLVRCRSLALSIIERFPETEEPGRSDKINALAKTLNLATAGSPPEVETGYQTDDEAAHAQWARQNPSILENWDDLPYGPQAADTSANSRSGADDIVDRAWAYAKLD